MEFTTTEHGAKKLLKDSYICSKNIANGITSASLEEKVG